MVQSFPQLQKFHSLAEEYFQFTYQAYPIWATYLGIHTHDHHLGDYDKKSVAEILAKERDFLTRLQVLDPGDWPVDEAIDHAFLASHIKSNIRYWDQLRFWERNPYEYVDTVVWGCYLLLTREFAPLEERLKSLLGRMKEVSSLLFTAKENLSQPPQIYTEIAISATEGSLGMFEEQIPALAHQVPEMTQDIVVTSQQVATSLRDYLNFLKSDLLPRSQGQFAIGRELYEEMLREEHFLNYTADTMLAIGRRLYKEIRERMEGLAREINPKKSLKEVLADLGKEHPLADGLLDVYRSEMSRAKEFALEKGLVTLPTQEELEIVETPPSFWSTVPYAMYMAPAPFEEEQKGIFFVTPVNPHAPQDQQEQKLAGHSLYKIPVVALHEGIPGHHLQLVWSNTVPSLIRKHAHSTLFVEGWAFYCEELMEQYGFITDPRSKLARLSQELWRAARIIVDSSLHAHGMSVPEAVEVIVGAGLEPVNARAEVNRYTMSPTQPMSYLIGKLEIMRLAEEYRRKKGSAFNLAQFHRELLSCGSLPPVLAARKILA